MKKEWLDSLKEYYKEDKRENFTRDDCHVVQLINSFIYPSHFGNHFCMVFEIMGVNLLDIIKRYNYKGVPMHICRILAKQILIGLDFLHRICNLIHTDLKPENILICLTQEEKLRIYQEGFITKQKKFYSRIEAYRKKHQIDIQDESRIYESYVEKKEEE